MKSTLLTLLIAVCSWWAYAQKSPIKYGDVPMEDLTMTVYDKDSSAVAVILADFGKAYVTLSEINATLNFERHIRIKILKKEGLRWADASIPLYHSGSGEEKVSNLKATTYNLVNGKVEATKMSKDGIFKEKFNRNINLQKFTLPNVKEGSVIEYSYTVLSEFLANFPNWQFQYSIPSKHTEYVAMIPDFFIMEQFMQGYIPVTTYEKKEASRTDYNEITHHWIIKSVPAFKIEPYMTSEEDYLSKINFALAYLNFRGQPSREIMGSWEKLAANLNESEAFGSILTGSSFLKKQVEVVLAGETDPLKKTKLIHDYVKATLEWNGTKDFLADNLKDVFERKKGTAGDINLALGSMLTKAGLEVDMVLLSTRDHGFVREQYPMSKQFNYVVCRVWVGDKFIYLDGTEPFIPVDVLPERCLNGRGLLVSRKNQGWVNISSKVKAKTIVSADLTMDVNSSLKGSVSYLHDGYEGQSVRRKIKEKGQESYLKGVSQGKNWNVETSTLENADKLDAPVKETHALTMEEHASVAGDVTYLDPFIVAKLEENPFRSEERKYPVDFGSLQEKTYLCKITIPAEYTVDEVPQSKILMLPGNGGKFMFNVTQMGNTINITNTIQINKTLFSSEEYGGLREFYNQIIAKQSEQIVLKKK